MNMHERIMAGKLFTDMCEGLPEERDEAKKRMIAFNLTTPDTLDERLRIQKEMLHEKSGEACFGVGGRTRAEAENEKGQAEKDGCA